MKLHASLKNCLFLLQQHTLLYMWCQFAITQWFSFCQFYFFTITAALCPSPFIQRSMRDKYSSLNYTYLKDIFSVGIQTQIANVLQFSHKFWRGISETQWWKTKKIRPHILNSFHWCVCMRVCVRVYTHAHTRAHTYYLNNIF